MILPVGSECHLNLPSCRSDEDANIQSVVGNRDRSLYAVLSIDALYIFLANPQLLLCVLQRTQEDVAEKGEFRALYWRHDSTSICATTSHRCLLIYRVTHGRDQCYNLVEPRDVHLQRASHELFMKEPRPVVEIALAVVARLDSPATCVVPLRDELFVCLRDGWMHRLQWSGKVDADFSFHLRSIPFASDQLQSKPEHVLADGSHVADIVYTPLIGGFCIVLSDGRAALLTSPSPRFHPNQLLAVWASNLNDATCTTTSHKFRLIIFGCKNGEIAAYHLDDANGALVQAYRISLSVKDNPVQQLQCFSQGAALAAIWSHRDARSGAGDGQDRGTQQAQSKKPVLALFSPFGTQWWCSLESAEQTSNDCGSYRCLDWGPEGFHLWLGSARHLSILPLARSITVSNPNMEHIEHTVMLASHQIFVSPPRHCEQAASAPHSVWRVLNVPYDYLASNWPLRFAAVERNAARCLLVAGARGIIHCNLITGKWRMFGNETQGFAAAACYDVEREREELRFYPLDRRLDNAFASRYETDARVLMLNTRGDNLVTFDLQARIFIYQLRRRTGGNGVDLCDVDRCAEIRSSDLVPHPACVVSIMLTSLNHDSSAACFCPGVDTVLVNVSGRLIMLSPLRRDSGVASGDASDSDNDDQFQLNQPMLIASFVEQVWHDPGSQVNDQLKSEKPHLSQALWINSGARGMKVWMPLFPGRGSQGAQKDSFRNFISKRIMLPFELDIHPIVMCSRDCLALGVVSVASLLASSNVAASGSESRNTANSDDSKPLYSLHRNSELLKRNLGLYALEIAATCRHLAYFGHVLELLLHHVLEEEATSSEPIPDPLLPRVIAFIQEFPEFLQTVAHCARKTELALWHALFAVTGHPRELFDVCIRDGQLETAASFLIVLQNMETSLASREQAAILLEEALTKRQWLIARDIVRFLRAIDPSDIDSPPRTPLCQKPPMLPGSGTSGRRLPLVSPKDTDETDAFVFGSYGAGLISRHRISSPTDGSIGATAVGGVSGPISMASVGRKDSGGVVAASLRKERVSKSQSIDRSSTNAMHDYLNDILKRHAAHLIEDCSMRDLGSFAAHLDFHLVLWLSGERARRARVADFVLALMRLHTQFRWPYPLASGIFVEQMNRRIGEMSLGRSSCSSLASLDEGTIHASPENGHASSTPLTVITRDGGSNIMSDRIASNGFYDSKGKNLSSGVVNRMKSVNSSSSNGHCEDREIEARLIPINSGNENVCVLPDDGLQSPSSPDTLSTNGSDWEGLERLCGETAARGTQESNAEALFMQQLVEESGCLEWFFLLCVLRRDLYSFERCLSHSPFSIAPIDTMQRLRDGVKALDLWADSSCPGYKSLLAAFDRSLQQASIALQENMSKTVPEIAPNAVATTPKSLLPSPPVPKKTSTNVANGVTPPISSPHLAQSFDRPNAARRQHPPASDNIVSATTPTEPGQCLIM